VLEEQKNDLEDELEADEEIIKVEQSFRNITRCASNEDDRCSCTGRVYYGEKFDRNQTLALHGQHTGLSQIGFEAMVKYPTLSRQIRGQTLYYCSLEYMWQGTEYTYYSSVTYPKQCFCEVNNNAPTNDWTW
jgi:hypothetical protein